MIIIAHRLTSIMLSDCIYLLDQGRMAGMGTHRELYNSSDIYKRLCDEQFVELHDNNKDSSAMA